MEGHKSQFALINTFRTRAEDVKRINETFADAIYVFHGNQQIVDAVTKLCDYGHEMVTWIHEYDYSEEVQGNGFRSLFESGLKLIQFGIKEVKSQREIVDFENLITNFANGLCYVQLLRVESNGNGSLELADDNLMLLELFQDFLKSDRQVEVFFTNCGMFQLDSNTRRAFQLVLSWKAFVNGPNLSDSLKSLVDVHFRNQLLVKLSKTVDIYRLKSNLDMITSSTILNRIYHNLLHGFNVPSMQSTIKVPRQTEFIIEMPKPRLVRYDNIGRRNQKTVSCRLFLEPKASAKSIFDDSQIAEYLLITCHGGGFSTGCAETNGLFLREWARSFPGMAILSVEITNAPDGRFPTQVQELLDVHLWFANPKNQDDVIKQIGFVPEKISFAGDSSGACIAMSTLIVLNDLRRKFKVLNLKFPTAIFNFYPAYDIRPVMRVSSLFCAWSQILNPIWICLMSDAYLPVNKPIRFGSDDESTPFLSRVTNRVLSNIRWALNWNDDKIETPAHLGEQETIKRIESMTELLNHPYVSPRAYEDFESLKDVHCYLMCCAVDPTLDQGVQMAKIWKGPLTLDVVENLPHGFLNMAFNESARQASEFAFNRIVKSFQND